MSFLKRILVVFAMLGAFGGIFMSAQTTVYADAQSAACEGIGATAGVSSGCNTGGPSLDNVIKLAINILSIVAGIVGIVMIIIGGLKYITSQGEGSQISAAKNTLIYALVGLVIAAMAQVIVRFVLHKAENPVVPKKTSSLHVARQA